MRLDESGFVRLALLRGFFNNLTLPLAPLSAPEPGRDAPPGRERPGLERIPDTPLPFRVTGEQNVNHPGDRFLDDPADADRQREGLQQRALCEGVKTGSHGLGQNRRHLIVFGNDDGQRLPDDRRGEKIMVVSPGLQRHARLLCDGRRRRPAVSRRQDGKYFGWPQGPLPFPARPRIEIRAANNFVREGLLPAAILGRALQTERDDRLPAIVAAIKGADPKVTLQAICQRLEAMRERTPRGRTKWRPSSVKMLLERAARLGLVF
jgi:hypothetical protein